MPHHHPERNAAKLRKPLPSRKDNATGSLGSARGELWRGLSQEAQSALATRDYATRSFGECIARTGIDVSQLVAADRADSEVANAWIPGVEIFARTIYPQRHRGLFGEFARREEGALARMGFWPQQWSAARMFARTAKGFHVHPPSVPEGTGPDDWFQRLFVEEPENFSLRRYEKEQWDVMFFVQGQAEMILREARAGLPRRTMRFFIDGDDHRGPNNAGVVIPPGVAHAIRVEGSEDLIMVYGTSTSFKAEFEGRVASEVETAELPASWEKFLAL
jgi:dTDP-4-dehydrorhamnose 3,5-epimerase-like enzyme